MAFEGVPSQKHGSDKRLCVSDSALDFTAGNYIKKNSKIVLDQNHKHIMLIAKDGKKLDKCKDSRDVSL